ncbi:MAG: hypothetical protein A2452_03215 [Candidatus Firestonebacteria bacterium RIFOXYC2_FULL_39_67]|nr:MAG: hypothetical protein A2536_02630 [Candidatus Firestonebacteria bacterium RIFOXYD2_FULL_39_29]OGF55277.1 MAG: hypothetical protein A2452_03215 [Candidatus Firestonebacteria bacterium RIFOXYC2_FULL_39_67]OGF57728.1 MAG: hypothetical protein A2497_08100 [Candidatus Firestonebacteria bacterium RifOxyC12_full_39_7]
MSMNKRKAVIVFVSLLAVAGSGIAKERQSSKKKTAVVKEVPEVTRIAITDAFGFPNGWAFYNKGQEIAKDTFNEQRNRVFTGNVPDGIVKEYYKSGKLLLEFNFKDNKMNGLYKSYYEDGVLWQEKNYKDGKENGIFKIYYENGKLMSEITYKDGKTNGMARSYNEEGKLKEEWNNTDTPPDETVIKEPVTTEKK